MKRITFSTNFNNKLCDKFFEHIDLAPNKIITEEEMNKAVFEVVCEDGSYPPVKCKVYNIWVLGLEQLTDALAKSSHNMSAFDLYNYILTKYFDYFLNKNLKTYDIKIALYYYSKIRLQ